MKTHTPIPFKITKSKNHALLVQVEEEAYFYDQLHYHPEFQITAIIKGEGIFYAGNNMSLFSEGDVFVVGGNVPHLLKCSGIYHREESPGVKGVSLFFDEFSFGEKFFQIKEMKAVRSLLDNCNRVIKVGGSRQAAIFDKIVNTTVVQQEQILITFLEMLSLLRQADKTYINSEQYSLILNNNEGGRLNEVLEYTFENFQQEITIEQIAKVAYLSRSQFSYFFKLHTGKTYIQFLNELRIENACMLMKNKQKTIEQVCYESGFKNVSHFVRCFKKAKSMTPSAFRKSWVGRL